jgi:hypothetical protein
MIAIGDAVKPVVAHVRRALARECLNKGLARG